MPQYQELPTETWEELKPDIERLYVKEGKPLRLVAIVLHQRRYFVTSVTTSRTGCSYWLISTNIGLVRYELA